MGHACISYAWSRRCKYVALWCTKCTGLLSGWTRRSLVKAGGGEGGVAVPYVCDRFEAGKYLRLPWWSFVLGESQ